jgi:hypothetical protein
MVIGSPEATPLAPKTTLTLSHEDRPWTAILAGAAEQIAEMASQERLVTMLIHCALHKYLLTLS